MNILQLFHFQANGFAVDQSQLACDLTIINAKRHELDTRLTVINAKLTRETQLEQFDGSLDLIVSNPPYVPNRDLKYLEPEIKM